MRCSEMDLINFTDSPDNANGLAGLKATSFPDTLGTSDPARVSRGRFLTPFLEELQRICRGMAQRRNSWAEHTECQKILIVCPHGTSDELGSSARM